MMPRLRGGKVVFDVRTVFEHQETALVDRVQELINGRDAKNR